MTPIFKHNRTIELEKSTMEIIDDFELHHEVNWCIGAIQPT